MIFDGFGVNPARKYNAWAQAKTPYLDEYFATNPHTLLQASGLAVGLPDGQFGNSEVGHLTLGTGRILEQELLRIAEAIGDGDLEEMPDWQNLLATGKRLHLVGLVSDGGVHSHIAHLLELLPFIVSQLCEGVDLSVGNTLRRGVLRTIAWTNPKTLALSAAARAQSVGRRGIRMARNHVSRRVVERSIKK